MKMAQQDGASLVFVAIALTCALSQPHQQRKCFNNFENFDECWQDIEEYCLNDQGEFEHCHQDTGEEEVEEEVLGEEVSYELSQHCYAS